MYTKRIIAGVLCAALLTAPISCVPDAHAVSAAEASHTEQTIDRITYQVYEDHAVAMLADSGIVNAAIQESVDGVPVTAIGEEAFMLCRSLRSVSIPDTVTAIGSRAFWYCDNLLSLSLPEGLTEIGADAFGNCDAITTLSLPEDIRSLPAYLFRHCLKLESVVIPDSVTEMGIGIFDGCDALTEVRLSASLTEIPSCTFEGCTLLTSVTIPEGVTSIGSQAFRDCTALTDVTLPSTLETISYYAFYGCSSLTALDLPDNLHNVSSSYVFAETPLLEAAEAASTDGLVYIDTLLYSFSGTLPEDGTLTVKEGTTCIAENALRISELSAISLPSTLRGIGRYGFNRCYALSSITVAEDNPYLTVQDGLLYTADFKKLLAAPCNGVQGSYTLPEGLEEICAYGFYRCEGLEEIRLPDTLTVIGDQAFMGCKGLTEISLPEGLTCLGDSAFESCTGLKTVRIPSELEIISTAAFRDCSALESVNIPYGITEIGQSAFRDCQSLQEVRLPDSVTTLGEGAFYRSGISNLVLSDNITELQATEYTTIYEGILDENGNVIEDGYTETEYVGLFNYTALQTLTLSNSVQRISDHVFWSVPLTDIYFYGSEEEWNAIDMGESGNGLVGVTMHFSAGTEGSGDANWDGALTVTDCIMLQKYLLQAGHVTNKVAADLNQDGTIDAFDLAILKQKLLDN